MDLRGDVAASFKNFSIADEKPVVETAVYESRSQVEIPDNVKDALLNYASSVRCK